MPELITETPESYESLALELAQDRDKLTALKQKLLDNKNSMALFDTPRFARALESAYETVWSRYEKGFQPDHMHINEMV